MTSLLNKCVENIESEDKNPYDSSVSGLSKGILNIYNSSLLNVEKNLKELTVKQEFLITQIHNENLSFAQVRFSPEIKDIFEKLKVYNTKLLNIKKDMKTVYERNLKLKKRAQRLQKAREREEQIKIKNELELKREENLIGAPQGPSNSTS